MRKKSLMIRKIFQKDNFAFTIEWNDGKIDHFRLSELQARCPCASCAGKMPVSDPRLRAKHIESVGQYAIKIQFASGCSNGIYDYSLLKEIGEGNACQTV